MNPADIDLEPTYGILLIGVLFATFFQGVLTVQVYQYYQDFPDDPRQTKVFVMILWVLDFIHLVLIAYTEYHYLVIGWGDMAVLMQLMLPFCAHLFPIALSTFLSQLFFLYRIWIFSQKKLLIVAPVLLCSLATFGLILGVAVGAVRLTGWPGGLVPMVVVAAITDVLIAGLLCYYVLKRSEGTRDMKMTSTLVGQVIRYTVATSAMTSFLILACLVAYFASPFTLTYIALHFSSGRTYSNSVLVNLNARRKFRETLGSIEPSFINSIGFANISNAVAVSRRQWHNRSAQERSSRAATTATRSDDIIKPEPLVLLPLRSYPPRSRHSLP